MNRFGRISISSARKNRIRRRPREECFSLFASISSLQHHHHLLPLQNQIEPRRRQSSQSIVYQRTYQRWDAGPKWFPSSPGRPSEYYAPLASRSFATDDSDTTITSSDLTSVHRQTTERLLNTPIGELNHQLWGETRMTILWWLQSSFDDKSTMSKHGTPSSQSVASESILKAFQLLDRMYHEEQEFLEDGKRDVPEFFDHELLNLVLNRWRLLVSSQCLVPEYHFHHDDSSSKDTPPQAGKKTLVVDPNDVLERLYGYQETSPSLQPDIQSYSMVIDTIASLVEIYDHDYSVAEKEDLMAKVDEIVDWLVDLASHDYDSRGMSETSGHEAAATGMDPENAAQEGRRQQQQPEQLYRAPVPNVVLFSSAMNAWTKSGLHGAAERVEGLLEQMISLRDWYPEWDIAPNKFTYSTAIDAWAKEKHVDKVRELLQRMHQQAVEDQDPSLKPGLPAFNGYLEALAKSGRVEEAEDLLRQMEDLYDSGELEEAPSVISYTTVIDGFARSRREGASARAESFLRRMMDRDDLSPNAVTYNSVINAHVQSFNIAAAEALLREMHETFLQSGNMEIRPTMHSYSVVISGIARSRRPDAGERAETILEQVWEMARSGDLDKPPDVVLYNAVLDCWAKLSSSTPETASRAVAFLEKMRDEKIVPDVISYNTIIHCLSQCGRTSDAELVLDQMKEAGVNPNSITYNTLLAAYTNRKNKKQQSKGSRIDTTSAEKLFGKMREDPSITPDVVTYNTMLNAYARGGDIEKAEVLLKEMFSEESPVSPDSTSINTVISAWTKSGKPNAPQRAEAILEEMLRSDTSWQEGGKPLGIRPTSITFNSVMSAWTKTRKPEAAERCQYLFDLMANNDVALIHPDFVTYNIMIHALSLSNQQDAPERAEALLLEMDRKVKDGNARMRPNTKTYGSLINVWSRSRRAESGQKAEEYLRKILQISEGKRNSHRQNSRSFREEQPRVFEFTSAIRAWYNSGDPIAPYKADEILYLLLQQVKKGNKQATPDSKLFSIILRTLAANSIPNKNVYADRILELMIKFKVEPNKALMDVLLRCYSDLKEETLPPGASSGSDTNESSTETEMLK